MDSSIERLETAGQAGKKGLRCFIAKRSSARGLPRRETSGVTERWLEADLKAPQRKNRRREFPAPQAHRRIDVGRPLGPIRKPAARKGKATRSDAEREFRSEG